MNVQFGYDLIDDKNCEKSYSPLAEPNLLLPTELLSSSSKKKKILMVFYVGLL